MNDIEAMAEARAIATYEAVHDDASKRTPWTHLPPGEWDKWRRAANAAPCQPMAMPPINEALVEILGRPNFTCIRIAQALRLGGHEIKSKAEYEQAHTIHFLLGQYFLHGADWIEKSNGALREMVASAKAAPSTEAAITGEKS